MASGLGQTYADNLHSRRFIFALEGPIYLLLAILDVLTHLAPTFEHSLTAFKILDIIIGAPYITVRAHLSLTASRPNTGAASFIPIFLFTIFLYLFKRAEFFPAFPNRFTFVANLFAVLVIPFLLITNEIGSFIGNNYGMHTVVSFDNRVAIKLALQFSFSFRPPPRPQPNLRLAHTTKPWNRPGSSLAASLLRSWPHTKLSRFSSSLSGYPPLSSTSAASRTPAVPRTKRTCLRARAGLRLASRSVQRKASRALPRVTLGSSSSGDYFACSGGHVLPLAWSKGASTDFVSAFV
jgi:hypothetical protein